MAEDDLVSNDRTARFQFVHIPAHLFTCSDLTDPDRVLIAFVAGLSKGGYVSVTYTAKCLHRTREVVARRVTALERKGYMVRVKRKKGQANQILLTDKAKGLISTCDNNTTPDVVETSRPSVMEASPPPVAEPSHNIKEIIKSIDKRESKHSQHTLKREHALDCRRVENIATAYEMSYALGYEKCEVSESNEALKLYRRLFHWGRDQQWVEIGPIVNKEIIDRLIAHDSEDTFNFVVNRYNKRKSRGKPMNIGYLLGDHADEEVMDALRAIGEDCADDDEF